MAVPLTASQLHAVLRSGGRELCWGLRAVSREVDRWRERAGAIRDDRLRAEAVRGLDHRRGHIDGAALLWTLPSRRAPALLRLLVAYEVMQDYLDGVSEHGARVGAEDATVLFSAVADALDPATPVRGDYYSELPWDDDGGYLVGLVATCRAELRGLPSFAAVRPLLVREAERTGVLWLNHIRAPAKRDERLRRWTTEMLPDDTGMPWYELAAAASGWITTLVLLALAAEPGLSETDAREIYDAYFPYFALSLTLLDSWADQFVDAKAGDHSYIEHYGSREAAVRRICAVVDRTADDVLALRHGERHAVVLACMVALYTTEHGMRARALKQSTERIVSSGGALTRLLVPAMGLWRLRNRRYGATH
jgi:tetraprenyl-beta-curcumene synthase